jgi:hypothetical protein
MASNQHENLRKYVWTVGTRGLKHVPEEVMDSIPGFLDIYFGVYPFRKEDPQDMSAKSRRAQARMVHDGYADSL